MREGQQNLFRPALNNYVPTLKTNENGLFKESVTARAQKVGCSRQLDVQGGIFVGQLCVWLVGFVLLFSVSGPCVRGARSFATVMLGQLRHQYAHVLL